jgi:hypothetical protein
MRLRPRIGIDINLVDDYGDIYVGPLEISWCNQAYYEPGSFGLDWGNKWHLYMTYYESCDPFTGTQDGWPGFVDWELCVHNDSKSTVLESNQLSNSLVGVSLPMDYQLS